MSDGGRIAIVDDDHAMCALLSDALTPLGFAVTTHQRGEDALAALGTSDIDCVVTDLNMPGLSGVELCERVAANRPDVPVVVITAFGSLDTAIAAIRAGAYDFIVKPFEIDTLAIALRRAVQHRRLRDEVVRLRRAIDARSVFDDMLGESAAMQAVYALVDQVADTDASVLITGESGTGKELVARALHHRSSRQRGPFVVLNCAAVPDALLESELFGHSRGAFTDAHAARKGLFLQAHGGTLLLDEIGEMPLALQPKLLRALQERAVRPVGGDGEVPFDVRIVTATNRDLETAVEEGRFREDLYFRINVINVETPPLRSRGNDILLLAQHFVDRLAARQRKRVTGISSAAAGRLLTYTWPGNVRELQNCVERAVAVTAFEQITVDDLPEKIRDYRRSHVLVSSDDPAELVPLEEVERRYILRVLEAVDGNKTVAARVLGLDRKTLYRKLGSFAA